MKMIGYGLVSVDGAAVGIWPLTIEAAKLSQARYAKDRSIETHVVEVYARAERITPVGVHNEEKGHGGS